MTTRYVAMGDSFTEGVGDDDPSYRNGLRGWADRVAEELARHEPTFGYANLAIRGRLLPGVVAQQLEPATALTPDLVTLYAGGNDLMRPQVDIDALAETYESAVEALTRTGATVVLFTGVDAVEAPLFRRMRGRTAIYNEHVRGIAARHGTLLVDMWAMRMLRDARMWSDDRLHLNANGHRTVAAAVLDALGAEHSLCATDLGPRPHKTRRAQRKENLHWAREHALPWVRRRLRGQSSGDTVSAKRPTLMPVTSIQSPTV